MECQKYLRICFQEFREMDEFAQVDHKRIRECLKKAMPDRGLDDGWPW